MQSDSHPTPHRALDAEFDLHVCGSCASPLVHPLRWEPVGTAHWLIERRCPECWWEGTAVFDQETVDRYDEELTDAADAIADDAMALARAATTEWVERFVAGVQAGQILPEDF